MKTFYGWGRKKSGFNAIKLANLNENSKFILREDGFIRSTGLGDSKSFSIVEDDLGIYYDAKTPSRLEFILSNYDFKSDIKLLKKAKHAIELIRKFKISKYNNGLQINKDYFKNLSKEKVLIIDQNKGDLSLKYGLAEKFNINQIIDIAISENPYSDIYIKVHPDVINLKKKSEINFKKLNHKCKIISDDINAISLLENFRKVYTRTSQMGFEALIMGCECIVFGMPFYAGWGLTDDRIECSRRKRNLSLIEVFAASYILYPKYNNPYSKQSSDIIDTIYTINRFKKIEKKRKNKLFLFGFSKWKHKFILPYLKEFDFEKVYFVNSNLKLYFEYARKFGLNENSSIYIWGAKMFPEIENFANKNKIKIVRVEDGFIRSVGLGSDLTRPLSLAFDDLGIYYNPLKESRLERILNNNIFDKHIISEAENLINKIVNLRISKYNFDQNMNFKLENSPYQKTILVVGQVEDDASIKMGGFGIDNAKLLKEVKKINPDAYIIYKSHPDVNCGNRKGNLSTNFLKQFCNLSLGNVNLSTLISMVDEVHTITSLVGFEALLQGKKVITYGLPFYAGWGLTEDRISSPRRKRNLSISELVAGALILYPRYIDPIDLNYCKPEVLVNRIKDQKYFMENNRRSRIINLLRNLIVRLLQKMVIKN